MTSHGNNFNYFPENQLTKFSAVLQFKHSKLCPYFCPPSSEDFSYAFCIARGAFGCQGCNSVPHVDSHTSWGADWGLQTSPKSGKVFWGPLLIFFVQYQQPKLKKIVSGFFTQKHGIHSIQRDGVSEMRFWKLVIRFQFDYGMSPNLIRLD